jgi:GNAT superfamily N-acetyltransferase
VIQSCTIRPFEPSDQEAVRRLILAGLGEHFGVIDESLNPDLDHITASYTACGGLFVLAECNGQLAATGALIEEGESTGRLVRMSVDPRFRRRGLARAIGAHLIDSARLRGYRRLLVETNDDWMDAIALYRACGFGAESWRDGEIHLSLDLD